MATKAMVALTDGIHHWKVLAPRKSLATVDVIAAGVPGKKDSAPVHHQGSREYALVQHHAEARRVGYNLL